MLLGKEKQPLSLRVMSTAAICEHLLGTRLLIFIPCSLLFWALVILWANRVQLGSSCLGLLCNCSRGWMGLWRLNWDGHPRWQELKLAIIWEFSWGCWPKGPQAASWRGLGISQQGSLSVITFLTWWPAYKKQEDEATRWVLRGQLEAIPTTSIVSLLPHAFG